MRKNPPNVLVIMTDDHAQWAVGCYGFSSIHSPAMDRLARDGAMLLNAFTPSPVCSPARASFLTGQLPSAHGIHCYFKEGEPWEGKHPGIKDQPTLLEILHDHGYRTGLIGKWHCAHNWLGRPGADTWDVLAQTQARPGDQRFYRKEDDGVVHPTTRYGEQAPMLTEEACDFIDAKDDRPFFLYVGFTDTHTPLDCLPERLVQRYRDDESVQPFDEPFSSVHGMPYQTMPKEAGAQREVLCQYLAAVTHVDEQVAAILQQLEAQGILDETLIIYTADHGHMTGKRGLLTKGNSTIPQNLLEPSIRVPCMLRWPSMIQAGQVHDAMVDHCDLHQTILEATGMSDLVEADELSPGRSYLSLLRGDDYEPKEFQFAEYGNARMVRTDRYKLIERYPGPNGHFPDEFYDLDANPCETTNVITAAEHTERIAALRHVLHEHFTRFQQEKTRGDRIADQPRPNETERWWMSLDDAKAGIGS